jgi:hypothetical protein
MRKQISLGLMFVVWTFVAISAADAGPFFDCLKSEKFVIPPITTPWGSTTGPIIIQPASTQSAPAQNGLSDYVLMKLIDSLFANGTNVTTTSGGSSTANATLDRIDGKLDKLQGLVLDRLTKVESDVATVAKAQKESTAQLEQRLVETTNLVNQNTKLIKANADAIQVNTKAVLQTQKETEFLASNAKVDLPKPAHAAEADVVPPAPAAGNDKTPPKKYPTFKLNQDVQVPVALADGKAQSVTLSQGTEVQKFLDLPDNVHVIILWKNPNDGESHHSVINKSVLDAPKK